MSEMRDVVVGVVVARVRERETCLCAQVMAANLTKREKRPRAPPNKFFHMA